MNQPLPAPAGYGVFIRMWQNGNLIDEQLVCRAPTFEAATAVSQRLTNNRVRLSNDDVTVSIEPLQDVQQAAQPVNP